MLSGAASNLYWLCWHLIFSISKGAEGKWCCLECRACLKIASEITILQPDFSGRCHGFLVLNSSATTHSNTGYFIFYHIEITYIPQLHTAALFIYCLNQPSNISLSLFNTNASHFSDTRKYLFEGTVTNLITPEYRQSITSSTREDFFHISNIGFKYSVVVLSFVFFGVR